MALGSTQPVTEMSTGNLPGAKGWLAHKAGNLATICEPIVLKMWESRYLNPVGLHGLLTGIALPFIM
jgi:hypothetical protein